MSNLPGNPYVGRLVTDGAPRTPESLTILALAYEQRTANLIAYIETFGGGIDYDDIWHEVGNRLGLGENNV